MILILMGVSGSGKTTIGKALAARLSIRFLDGDDFHSAAAIEKMQNGSPLTDADRLPWLNRLNKEALNAWRRSDSVVIACSALKKQYREALSCGLPEFEVTFIWLAPPLHLLEKRLRQRSHQFMPASLLESQLCDFEPPDDAIKVVNDLPPAEVVEHLLSLL